MIRINTTQKCLRSPLLWAGVVGSICLILSGCVKDPIYNTDHPDKAQVTVNTVWSDIGTDIDKPTTYIIATGNIKKEINTDTYMLNTPLDPGVHTFYFYNNVTQIPVTEGVANVNTTIAQRSGDGIYIEPLPGWLFTGTFSQQLEKDSEYQFTVPMHQQVRQLTLVIEPHASSADRITAITAQLSGVARQYNISNNTHNQASDVAFDFTRITQGEDAGKWLATIRLLGIAGAEQKLSCKISFTNRSSETFLIENDLSSVLADFNNDKKNPLRLGAQIIEVPTSSGFTAIIVDWKKVISGTGIAQ